MISTRRFVTADRRAHKRDGPSPLDTASACGTSRHPRRRGCGFGGAGGGRDAFYGRLNQSGRCPLDDDSPLSRTYSAWCGIRTNIGADSRRNDQVDEHRRSEHAAREGTPPRRAETGDSELRVKDLLAFAEACGARPEELVAGIVKPPATQLVLDLDPPVGRAVLKLVDVLKQQMPRHGQAAKAS